MLFLYVISTTFVLSFLTALHYLISKNKITGFMFLFFFSSFVGSGVIYKNNIRYWGTYAYTKIKKRLYPKPIKPKEKVCSFSKNVLPPLKKDNYKRHRKAGSLLKDVKYVKNDTLKNQLINSGILVKITPQNNGFVVAHMDFGSPYVHKTTSEVLKELERRFLEKIQEQELSNMRFKISSALRTEEEQVGIRKRYPGQATFGISSHSYGASVDISKVYGKDCEIGRIFLANILQDMQKEERIYLTPESTTIHITARK
jgi:hypothetical protein